jgi:uncharacterized protein YutE (UPF0331/DUF86 family)
MNNILTNKAASLERCLKRIRDEYTGFEDALLTNFTKQDSIVLNLERSCQICIDMALVVIKSQHWGIPQNTRDVFALLHDQKVLDNALSTRLQKMVGFRNIAVHEYQNLNMAIIRNIVETRLDDFISFSRILIQKFGQ